jgi:hypothetical protein
MAQGGYRPGAGRKKGVATIAAEHARGEIARMIAEELPPIVQALVGKAKGDKRFKTADTMAIKEALERVAGKVTDKLLIQEAKKLLQFDE